MRPGGRMPQRRRQPAPEEAEAAEVEAEEEAEEELEELPDDLRNPHVIQGDEMEALEEGIAREVELAVEEEGMVQNAIDVLQRAQSQNERQLQQQAEKAEFLQQLELAQQEMESQRQEHDQLENNGDNLFDKEQIALLAQLNEQQAVGW